MIMELLELQGIYARHPHTKALASMLEDNSVRTIFLGGLYASAASLVMSALTGKKTVLVVLNDLEEAGYFYHDLVQIIGDKKALFFPSSFRRAIKYGQKDPANEILRTEVLARLRMRDAEKSKEPLFVISYPEALAEQVVSQEELADKTLVLSRGEKVGSTAIQKRLTDEVFPQVDYVSEPGQYAVRGSLVDVYSFSSEYPDRIDFLGNDIDGIRSFDA